MEEYIRENPSGRIIGVLVHKPNGDVEVRNFSRQILGYYKASRNVTTDFYGRVIASGNCASALVYKDLFEK